jgi:hypothetical protein
MLVFLCGLPGYGQFTTILNVPPNIGNNQTIRSSTQVNVSAAGAIGSNFNAGASNGTSTNVQVNSAGFLSQNFKANGGSVVNITGGNVASSFSANSGSTVNITGGNIGFGFTAASGSVVNIKGGVISDNFSAASGSTLNISGGLFPEAVVTGSGTTLTLSGNEFRIDDVPVAGLGAIGNTATVNIFNTGVLTGTLEDGTPFVFTRRDGDTDQIAGPITLKAAALPAVGPAVINLPPGSAPNSVRAGQTINVGAGGFLPYTFQAGRGSTVNINGGTANASLEAAGATVNLNAGNLGDGFDAYRGTVLNVSGGTVGWHLNAGAGSVVNINGGIVGPDMRAYSGSQIKLAGGVVGYGLLAFSGSSLRIQGSEIRVDGQLVPGLQSIGSSTNITLPSDSVLSGTLSDGSPFMFGSDDLLSGTLTLEATSVPAIGPAVINVPGSAAPQSIRAGQKLILSSGGTLPDYFEAGWGSEVQITGGTVGKYFEVANSHVSISSATIGELFGAYSGSVIDMASGAFSGDVRVADHSVFNMRGGSVHQSVYTQSGSRATISGGTVGNYGGCASGSVLQIAGGAIGDQLSISGELRVSAGSVGDHMQVNANGVVNMTGGSVGEWITGWEGSTFNIAGGFVDQWFTAWTGSVVNFSGGTAVGDRFSALGGSAVHLYGTHFVLDGVDVTSTLTPNVPLAISDRGVTLLTSFADGNAVSMLLNVSGDGQHGSIDPSTVVTITLIDFMPGDFNRDGNVDGADYAVWRKLQNSVASSAGAGADGNFDGKVTDADLDVWRAHFRQHLGMPGSGAVAQVEVPEPSGFILLIAFVGTWIAHFRTRQSLGLAAAGR